MLDNGLYLSANAFKFLTNLVTVPSMKRKWNVVTIETKLETIDQLAIGVRVSFLVVRCNIGIVIRLSEPQSVSINLDNGCSTVLVMNYLCFFPVY